MPNAEYKVLHVLTVRYGANGLTRCAMNYITHFQHTRADIACGFLLPAEVAADFSVRGARAVQLPKRLRQPIRYCRALTKLIREEGYALVEVHGNSCTMALELYAAFKGGARARVPHAHNTRCSLPWLHKLLRPAFEKYRTAAFACGQAAGEWLYEGKPFTIVKNAIDTAVFAYDEQARIKTRGALGLDGCFVLGHVGGFNRQKNHALLMEIFKALCKAEPNAALVMAGDGPLREECEQAARLAGLNYRILQNCRDVASLYMAMDAFVLPSLFEGLPFTLVEAQASGLPCFAADVVTREAAMGGALRFMEPEASAEDYAAAIKAERVDARAALSASARESIRARGYDITCEAAALEGLYAELIAEARA